MPHGAPDHTRLSDDAHSHYQYTYISGGGIPVPSLARYDLVDIDMVGIFGIAFLLSDNKGTYLRMEVDGRQIFELAASDVFKDIGLGKGGLHGVIGSSMYDEVNDKYSLWYNNDWRIYVHNHLLVEVYNFTINPCLIAAVWCEYATYTG